MPSLQRAAYEFNRAAKDLEKASADMRKSMEAQFGSLSQITHQVKSIHFFVARKLTGKIRRILNSNWAASGLKSRTGRLKAAAIDGAVIDVTAGGIVISYQGGLEKQIYVQGAALNHGAVHGGKGIGARTKKGIKKAALKKTPEGGSAGAVHVTPPHPFYFLSASQVGELQTEYVRLWQQELDRRLGKGTATAAKGR